MFKRYSKKIRERLINHSKVDPLFDIEFWQEAGVRARFAATWKAIEELYKIRGIHGYKLRLQRSIGRFREIRVED